MPRSEPTPPSEPSAEGPAEQECDVITQECPLKCPEMEIEVNETPETDDDLVRVHSEEERPTIPCRIRATSEASGARAVLSNPDGRLRFPGQNVETHTVPLPDDGSWADFEISGQTRSEAASDALIEAHCDSAEGPLKAQSAVTVCSIDIESETELEYPEDRERTHLGVTERVTLRANRALGEVSWSIIEGHGTLETEDGQSQRYPPEEAANEAGTGEEAEGTTEGEAELGAGEGTAPGAEEETEGGSEEETPITDAGEGEGAEEESEAAPVPTVEGETVTFIAHHLEEETTVQAEDAAGCKRTIEFDVDCNYLITPSRLREIFPAATDDRIEELTRAFNESYEHFGLDTCLRRSHFFAQVLAEVGTGANPRTESMNYSADRLPEVFAYFREHEDEAEEFGRTDEHAADQPAIANRAYANRLGNGNIAGGDGWAYRGRGYIQLTGRANYSAIQDEIDARFPDSGIDIVEDSDQATATRGGLISALAFWTRNDLNAVADRGATDEDVDDVTDEVNYYTNHRDRRINNFHTTRDIFHVTECPRSGDGDEEDETEAEDAGEGGDAAEAGDEEADGDE